MEKKYLKVEAEYLKKLEKNNKERVKVEPEHLMIAEFGKHYGYGGIEAIFEGKITSEQMAWLLSAARKVDSARMYDAAQTSFIGAASAQAKNPGNAFEKMTSRLKTLMKSDE
jgi:hypothetical protein